MKVRPLISCVGLVAIATIATAQSAAAAVISIPPGDFGPGSTLTTFDGETDFEEVDSSTVDGILFEYSPGAGHLQFRDVLNLSLGNTNNVDGMALVSVDLNTGTLSMILPFEASAFGYGFAVSVINATVLDATTISLFKGSTPVGSLSFDGVPDPDFAGGFAGIRSTEAFDRVDVTFTGVALAFALDNVRVEPASVPEPATMLLLGAGLAGFCTRRRLR